MSETQGMGAAPGNPQLTGNMFLFERPELLSKEQHGHLGIGSPEKRFGFCAKARAVPITVTEVPVASRDYPIIFLSNENPVLLAVTGLIDDVNLFVDEKGDWESTCYVPGYIRRYPFGIANESGSDRMAVVLDAAFDGLSPNGERPLFENGEPSETTKGAVEFCQAFESDRAMTEEFASRVQALDIISSQTAHFTPKGATEPKVFAEYFGVDEAKLTALTDEQFLSLREGNALAAIHALLMSMTNWRSLLQRRAERFNLSENNIFDRAIN